MYIEDPLIHKYVCIHVHTCIHVYTCTNCPQIITKNKDILHQSFICHVAHRKIGWIWFEIIWKIYPHFAGLEQGRTLTSSYGKYHDKVLFTVQYVREDVKISDPSIWAETFSSGGCGTRLSIRRQGWNNWCWGKGLVCYLAL